jgi:dolichyl-phosphate beta-glucosyltransferase
MDSLPKTIIIVPCYNEAKRLDIAAFKAAVTELPNLVFIFVNDGSQDDTARILDGLHLENPEQMQVHHLPGNQGKAGAVFSGFQLALPQDCERIGYWDADLATPLSAIADLSSSMSKFQSDAILASRVQLLGREINRDRLRHFIGRVFATTVSIYLNLRIYDSQCGAKIFKKSPALEDVFRTPFTVGWIFDVELISRFIIASHKHKCFRSNRSIIEYPLFKWTDIGGSKISLKHYFIAIRDMTKLWLKYRKNLMELCD